MSRVSETNELIERMNTSLRGVSVDAIIATFLGNIALFLAVIADKMEEQADD